MNSFKRILLAAALTLCAFTVVFYTSCSKKETVDPCSGVSCLNGGKCNAGKCVCPTGFGGTYCETNLDPCLNVTCQNGGTCSAGTCACPTGVGGTNCETIYRDGYNNTYRGDGTDNGTPAGIYTYWRLVFTNAGTDRTKMEMVLRDASNAPIITLPIVLSAFSATGSSFTITSTVESGYTYTGSGTISGTKASLSLTETGTTGPALVYTFANMTKL